ncbi:MAG: hypothetical protein DWQ11_19885 [Proteobacteria bacterium]|nr:MAG: hypothetical protein DWQ11_19885 [Pseudomonadota bacterium]
MKFDIGDETDQALTTTLIHELVLCKDSFERFAALAKMNIMGRRDKAIKIKCHDAYASFLHHLYEFYVGCIKRDLRNTDNLHNDILDKIFNREVTKLLKNRVDAIQGGYAPSWENHISVYQVEVPTEFGAQFRRIRNRTAHASIKRSVPGNELPLGQFYEKYHGFVYLLYYSAQWLWTVKDIEAHDWKSIEDFDLAVQG